MQKIDTVNQIHKSTSDKIKILSKKWNVANPLVDMHSDTVNFLSSDSREEGCKFLLLNKDGTYTFSYCAGVESFTHETGKWSITEDNKIKMVSPKRTTVALIDYLSNVWLTLIYQE